MSTTTTAKQHDFPPLKNDLLLRAARGEQVERSPVWIMRQAGRYLPEFRAVRQEHDFFQVCQTPELACQVTLQPIDRFDGLLDAAIIFSDILVIPQALGMTVVMNPGPIFPNPLETAEEVETLLRHCQTVNVAKVLEYVYEGITLTRHRLQGRVPLIGFSGAPWTLFAYMLDTSRTGSGSKTHWSSSKTFMRQHPDLACRLLDQLAQTCAEHLIHQVRAGAQLVQVFDSWAGDLTPQEFEQFSLPYLKQIASRVKSTLSESQQLVPMTVFPKGVHDPVCLQHLAQAGYDVIGLDWSISPQSVRSILKDVHLDTPVTLQGNFDPTLLLSPPDVIRQTVQDAFSSGQWQGGHRHICNLGHGITPSVDPDHLRVFLQAVHDFGKQS